MTATPLLDAILSSPCLPDYAEAINTRLQEERRRRQHFYADMSDAEKTEFIEGEVVMHSPARHWHLEAKKHLVLLLDLHVRTKRLGQVLDEKCLCVFPRNDYEPDVVFFGPAKTAGLKPDTLKFPIPDLAVEILSESTERRDRGVKFTDYEAHGVGEYWIIDAEARVLEQYVLSNGAYRLVHKSGTGIVTSALVAGFSIPVPAIFDGEENLKALRGLL